MGGLPYQTLLPSVYQTAAAYQGVPIYPAAAVYQTAPEVAPVQPAAPGAVDPAFLNTPAAQLVDIALATLNQRLPAVDNVFSSVGNNRLVTKLLSSSSCPFDIGGIVGRFVAAASQSRAELTAVVETIQSMARAGLANDAPAAVRAVSGTIGAVEPLLPRFAAILPFVRFRVHASS